MQDSGHSSPQKSATSSKTSSPAVREAASTGDTAVKDQPKTGDPAVRDQPRTGDPALTVPGSRTDSLGNASTVSDSYNYHVKAGLQRVLQVFITNSGNVFLLEASDATVSEMAAKLDEQVTIIGTGLVSGMIRGHFLSDYHIFSVCIFVTKCLNSLFLGGHVQKNS